MDFNAIQGRGVAQDTDSYTVNLTVGVEALMSLGIYFIKFLNANTGASTLNVNGLGAKTIQTNKLTGLSANDIRAGSIHILVFDTAADIFQAVTIHV